MLKQLRFEGGSTRAFSHPETMQNIIICDRLPDASFDHPQHIFPEEFYKPYASEINVNLHQDEDRLPGEFFWQCAVDEGRVYQVN